MPEGPLFAYREMRRAGDIKHDPAQELASEKLQLLCHELRGYNPEQQQKSSGGIRALFGRGRRDKAEDSMPNGLYIFGDVGRGKSMLMDLFFDHVPVAGKRRVHFHAFMQEVHAQLHAWRQRTRARTGVALPLGDSKRDDPIPAVAEGVLANGYLLCFDEFHVTNIADAMILGRLFEALFARGVVVVCTSNWAPDDLYKDGLQRDRFLPFIALIKEKLDVFHLSGEQDYRMDRIKGMATFYAPLGDAATTSLREAFQRLADGEPGVPDELTVQGRTLPVPHAASGVAWFGFADLCAKPLGAADYLAIARRYHTVVMDGIPKLSPANRNEARRFMTLIDALYEHKVKLVCAAEAQPHGLYPAGDGAKEFLRTVSRLVEMQSRDYYALEHAA